MKTKISLIVPVYNSESTLKECLDSIFLSSFKEFEVIVISDNSSDKSAQIAKKYNCKVIELSENMGPAYVRNLGAKNAEGEILFFIDSDIVIKPNSLSCIKDSFDNNEVNVIQGIYSHKPDYNNVVTQFQQSFLCYYTWSHKIKYVETLTSACFAIRKKVFIDLKGFNTNIKSATVEDEEFGYNLIDKGNKILILRELNVEHKINLTISKFIKRNFIMNFNTMKSFLRNRNFIKKKMNQNNYTSVLSGILLLGFIILMIIVMPFFLNEKIIISFLILNIMFLSLNYKFINFVYLEKGPKKALGILITCYLSSFLMLIGIVCAFISYFFGKKY